MNDSISVAILVGVGGLIMAALTYYAGTKKQSKQDGKLEGQVATDLSYIKHGIDEIKKEQIASNEKYEKLLERIITNEEKTKSAHKRLDEYVTFINGLIKSKEEKL